MLKILRFALSKPQGNKQLFDTRCYRTGATVFNEATSLNVQSKHEESKPNFQELSSAEICGRLMKFYDLPGNWTKDEVKSGRNWRKDELRIKSNSDLHKLWYILYIERNMLMTMEEAAKEQVENMISPERLDKVEESMKNIETVIHERNRAYWELEVGDTRFASRRRSFRRDIFGRWRWIACSEHLIPYWMNNEWRKSNAPGFGPEVIDFNRKLRELKHNKLSSNVFRRSFHVRQLMKRFDTLDLDHLQERYPDIDVKYIKQNLDQYTLQDRNRRFNSLFYHAKKEL